MTFDDFKKVRPVDSEGAIQIVISLGTCGIAAGGQLLFDYFEKEIKRRELGHVVLKKTGCLGLCSDEPNVIIRTAGKPDVMYGNVTEAIAEKILNKHIAQGSVLNEIAMAFPSEDFFLIAKKGAV